MASGKQNDELKQAVKLLKLLSETKRAAVVHLIQALAEDEDADLYADPEAVAHDLECAARVREGDLSQTVSSAEVRRQLGLPARRAAASV